jgi:hypothetical protein
MDLIGKWQAFGADGLEEEDGDNVYKGVFVVRWSAFAAAKATLLIVNELATLP